MSLTRTRRELVISILLLSLLYIQHDCQLGAEVSARAAPVGFGTEYLLWLLSSDVFADSMLSVWV
jgi:hypothetical protein